MMKGAHLGTLVQMSASGIILPSDQVIDQWNDLREFPIVGTAPRSVPLSTFVETPTAEFFNRVPAFAACTTCMMTVQYVNELGTYIDKMHTHFAYIYSLRPMTRGLFDALKESNAPVGKIFDTAVEMLKKLTDSLTIIKTESESAVKRISEIFHLSDFWERGYYSNLLVDHISILLFKLFSLGKLCPTRRALSDDISNLRKLAQKDKTKDALILDTIFAPELRFWMSTPNSLRKQLVALLNDLPYTRIKLLFDVFWNRIRLSFTNNTIIYAETQTAYIVTLLFMMDLYSQRQQAEKNEPDRKKKDKLVLKEFKPEVFNFVRAQRTAHPALILGFEFAVDFDEFSTEFNFREDKEERRFDAKLKENLTDLRKLFGDLSHQYSQITFSDTPGKDLVVNFVKLLPQVLQKLSFSIRTISELIIDKYNSTPDIEVKIPTVSDQKQYKKLPASRYELAMRMTLIEDEREKIMQILALCRSIRELIVSNIPRLTQIISKYIEEQVQDFVKNQLEVALIRSVKVKEFMQNDIEKLRVFIGYFKNDKDLQVRGTKKSDLIPHPINEPTCAPYLSLIELLRTNIQTFINPENPMMAKKMMAKNIAGDDLVDFQNFLNKSAHYVDLLRLDYSLNIVSDQSSLFFKEFFLDLYRNTGQVKELTSAVYFPVTTSLPYILIDYAINHSNKQDLVGALFYPLSIYDDAAAQALKLLKSKMIYNEIKAESEICLTTISQMIADFAFKALQIYTTSRYFDQFNSNIMEDNMEKYDGASAMRIANILQQNQLFLLGQQIDIKGLFAERLNEVFSNNIEQHFKIVENHGVAGIVVFNRMMDVFREVHSVFLNYGIPLIQFDDLIRSVLHTDTPNSFSSLLLQDAASFITTEIVPKFFLHTNPYRFVPPFHQAKKINDFMKSNLIPNILRQTTAFITVEHFRELFSLLDEGAIFILCSLVRDIVKSKFGELCSAYSELKTMVRRISDIPIGTGCHKAFDQFEGAYRSFITEPIVDKIFEAMRALGNIIAVAEMLDVAFALKRSSSQQILAYLFMTKPSDIDTKSDELFSLFDKKFQDCSKYFDGATVAPSKEEIAPPFMQNIIAELARTCQEKWSLFEEESSTILDFQSLTGFAAIWSVLEFVFCLKEVHRKEDFSGGETKKNTGAFGLFGEGVLLCAAALLCILRQQPLSRALSIGTRIVQQKRTDLAVLEDDVLNKYLVVYELVQNSIDYALSSISPAVNSLFKQ